jgi:hypothetical protein
MPSAPESILSCSDIIHPRLEFAYRLHLRTTRIIMDSRIVSPSFSSSDFYIWER